MKNIIVKKIINKMLLAMPLLISAPLVVASYEHKSDLSRAIQKGDLTAVEKFVKWGIRDVNSQDAWGTTYLHLAVCSGKGAIVEALLKAERIDINNRDCRYGEPPLCLAIRNGNIEIAKILLKNSKINVNMSDSQGYTPLYRAVYNEDTEIVEVLLNKGANPNIGNKYGDTPLKLAEQDGNEQIKRLLREAIERIKTINVALIKAIRLNDRTLVKKFIQEGRIDVNLQGDDGSTPFHVAVDISWDTGIISALLNVDGINVNKKDTDGNTPLHRAVFRGNKDIIKVLLEVEGIKANKPNKDYHTPLHMAVRKGDIGIIKTLLESNKINVNIPNKLGNTSLHMAVDYENAAVVKILLENKEIYVNFPNKLGNTPLHLAVLRENEVIVKILLEKEANLFIKNREMYTPLDVALDRNNEKIIGLLKETMKRKNNDYLINTIHNNDLSLVNILLGNNEIDVNRPSGPLGYTPLHYAVLNGKTEDIVRALLNEGANPGVKDNIGNTPLHLAASKGYTAIVWALLEKGADPFVKNASGYTPLELANNEEIKGLLREAIQH